MKAGILVVAELEGDVAERIHEVQRRFDPRMAAELPPHVTLAGSSGMGPISPGTPVAELDAKLRPIAESTAPIAVRFDPPMRFMQKRVVVLPMDPHGPLRTLHERIRTAGLPHEPPRFAFTPHCTLNFYRELPDDELRELLRVRVPEPIVIRRIACNLALMPGHSRTLLELDLTGTA